MRMICKFLAWWRRPGLIHLTRSTCVDQQKAVIAQEQEEMHRVLERLETEAGVFRRQHRRSKT